MVSNCGIFTVTAVWNKKTYFRTIRIFLLSECISNGGIWKKIREFLSPVNWNCFLWHMVPRLPKTPLLSQPKTTPCYANPYKLLLLMGLGCKHLHGDIPIVPMPLSEEVQVPQETKPPDIFLERSPVPLRRSPRFSGEANFGLNSIQTVLPREGVENLSPEIDLGEETISFNATNVQLDISKMYFWAA